MDDEIWEQGVLESVEVNGSASLSPTLDFRAWTALTDADFSGNDLPYIDESVVNSKIFHVILHLVPENLHTPPMCTEGIGISGRWGCSEIPKN